LNGAPVPAKGVAMLQILQLEDDPLDAQLTLRLLTEAGLEVEVERVHTFVEFQSSLQRKAPSVILADYTVPGVDVLRALQWARQTQPDVPFIFLSGTLGEDVAIETLKMGATDYVLKQRIVRLVPAVRRALQEARVQSQRKRAEQDLRESEGRYRALLEQAPDAVVVFQNWRLVYVNVAALRLCGATALDQMWGKDVFGFFPPEDQEAIRESTQRLLNGSSLPLRETRVRRLDGREVPVEVTSSRVDWLGQPAVQTMLRDITERKRMERELYAAKDELQYANERLERAVQERTAELGEAIEDLNRFSYAVMHDMRSPLRAMHGFATLMESAGSYSTESLDFLKRIKDAATQLDKLIQGAAVYSQVLRDRPALVPVNLRRLVRQAAHSLPELQPSVADVCVEEPLPVVLGNKVALMHCLDNLLANAAKFVALGVRPRVRIWAESLPPRPSSHPGAPPDLWARLWVEDNGIGIAPEHQARIFEVFYRLDQSYQGTGIGLAIVRKAAERVGGHAGVESELGRGSKFWLELRRFAGAPPGGLGEHRTDQPTKGGVRGAAA
jgi:PAS domain S-box-containing protein